MKKLLTTVAALACLLTVTACNTIEGVGKDVKKGGEAVEGAASKGKS